ncbi:hypothetical protein Tco_1406077 [Tanacetum coccineum]
MTTLQFADTQNLVAFLSKPAKTEGFEQIVDFLNVNPIRYVPTINPTIYTSCIEQFWATVKVKTINGEVQLQALVDGKKIIITEASVRRDLQLNDEEGTDCLPNATILKNLQGWGMKNFHRSLHSIRHSFLLNGNSLFIPILQFLNAKTTAWNEFSSTMASAIICLATNQKFNFSKYIFESMVKNLENVSGKFLMYPRFVQVFLEKQLEGMSNHKRIYVSPSHTKKIFRNMRRIMAASAIAISSDSSDESVGSPPSRVILFGDIPTVIPSTSVVAPETSTIAPVISSAAPVVETTLVASPTGLCGLVPYSGSDSDSPDEMSSPEHISPLPAISPFLCTDSYEAPDSFDGPPSQDPYIATVARWRSRITAPILIRLGEAIPFGRPYRTHLNRPRKLLTARKRVGPLPARRLESRHASPRSSDHRSSSSSSSLDSSPIHSSGLDASDQAHSRSSTRDVSPRLCYPPRRAPRRSEAFRRWCATPLSTLYPPTTSESSSGDSSERPLHSSSHSVGPSRKRCRSPVDYVPSSTPVMGSLAPTRADLLPPRKRFRDSYSSEASIEEDTNIDPIETEVDMGLGIGDGDDVRDHVEIDPRDVRDDTEEYEAETSAGDTVKVGIDPMSAPIVEEEIVEPVGEDPFDSSDTRDDIVRLFEDMLIDLDDVVRDFYHHMSEVRIDRIVGIETAQRRLEADQLIARGQRVSMIERIDSLRLENLKVRAMLDIERDRVNSLRLHMSLSQEEFRQVRRDRDDTRGRLRRLESYVERRLGFRP